MRWFPYSLTGDSGMQGPQVQGRALNRAKKWSALRLGQGLCDWANHFYVDTFEWLTLNGLSSRHIKVSSIYPLSQLLVLINTRKALSLALRCLGASVWLPVSPSLSQQRAETLAVAPAGAAEEDGADPGPARTGASVSRGTEAVFQPPSHAATAVSNGQPPSRDGNPTLEPSLDVRGLERLVGLRGLSTEGFASSPDTHHR